MTWKHSSLDADIEKEILIGLITNDKYITELEPIFQRQLLQIPFSKIVSDWCFDYFRKYQKAPSSNIKEIYNSYANSKKPDEAQVVLIGKFLSSLSEQNESSNIQYSIDKAERYFRARKIELHRDNLSALLISQKIDEAEKEIASFKRIGRSKTIGVDIIRDNISSVLFEDDDMLFKFPGDLGELMSSISREDYILIAAPMKRGKTWWLQEFGIRGLMRGLNVIYYSLEMSEKKMLRRIYQNLMGETKGESVIEDYPYFIKNRIEIKEKRKKGLQINAIQKKKKQIETMLSKNSFRLCVFPTGSINVGDIKVHLDNLDHYNHFIPDVIIIDYADILAPEREWAKEERHKLNETQKALRGLAQERHCVVITGTQTTRDTFKNKIEEDSIAEDVRKLAHATSVIALNQTKEDKKKNVMRVSMLVARDDEFHIDDEVVCLQCLKIGKPCLDSRWAKKIENL